MRIYGLGIIGLGDVTERFIDAAKKLGIRVMAAADIIDEVEAAKRMNKLGISEAKFFKVKNNELPEGFFDSGVDIVYIASPHNPIDTHPLYVQQAAKHGKFIILEKPPSAFPTGRKEIEDASKKVKILSANHHQFYPAFLYLVRLVQSGELCVLGRITNIEGDVLEIDRLTHLRNTWLFRGPGIGVDTLPHLLVKLFTLGAEEVEVNKAYWDSPFDKGTEVVIGGRRLPTNLFTTEIGSRSGKPRSSETFIEIKLTVKNGENFVPGALAHFRAGKLMPIDSRKFVVNFEHGEAIFADHNTFEVRGENSLLFEVTAKGNPYVSVLVNALRYFETGEDRFNTLVNALRSMEKIFESYEIMERVKIYNPLDWHDLIVQ